MKYFITAFVTGVLVFLGATLYYKGLPDFVSPKGVSVTSTEVATIGVPTPSPTPNDEAEVLTVAIKEALIAKYGCVDYIVVISCRYNYTITGFSCKLFPPKSLLSILPPQTL